jgi:putative ABC transport system permease protein
MMLSENVRMAFASVRKARFRSFFTMLGIIIGVVSAITIISLGEGVKRQVSGQINQLGSNIITVRPGKLVNRNAEGEITSVNLVTSIGTSTLTDQDVSKLRGIDNIEKVVPFSVVSAAGQYEGRTMDGMIIATSAAFPDVVHQKIEFGTFFTDGEGGRRTAIIGPGVAEKLFKENIPISKTVKIKGQEFIVRGVFEKFPENPASPGTDFNDTIFINSEAGRMLANNSPLSIYELLIKPHDAKKIDQTVKEITSTIKSSHAGQEDFTVFKQEETLRVATNVVNLISAMVLAMAGVTLIVGGVGIMNVMLASVSERQREIGIRKAIGATNRQIRSQFMVEAAVLSLWGVTIGIALSLLTNFLLRIFTDLKPVITWQPVLVVSLISIGIGIIFGVIPALKAARKDPIDALRPQ